MKKVVFTFGRFQTPTIGHAKLVNKVIDLAKQLGAENRIYTSHSQDAKKNPLPYADKVYFLRQLFPKANVIKDDKAISAFQIAKELSDSGYTHVTMIVGDDRVQDFDSQIRKYILPRSNPKFDAKKNYGFDHFEVVSAGARDENAKGVEGASGTKMREFIHTNNFPEFAKNTPTTNITLARKIFVAAKRHLKESLNEGCNDKSIFKAVFLVGGAGSGKDFVMKKTLYGLGLVEINSDTAFEHQMRKSNISFAMIDSETARRDLARSQAKETTNNKEKLAIQGRLGLIINGVGSGTDKIKSQKQYLESLGYETRMLFISVPDHVSKERNELRYKLGGRYVPEHIRQAKWAAVDLNKTYFSNLFGSNFIEFDNSKEFTRDESAYLAVFKSMRNWVNTPVHNPIAHSWLSKERKSCNINEEFQSFINGLE